VIELNYIDETIEKDENTALRIASVGRMFSFSKEPCIKIIKDNWENISLEETPDLIFLDPPFDYDYTKLLKLDASVITVFSRGKNVFPYLVEKTNQGYGYHSVCNLTPANGVNAPTMPSNTFEVIHILRKGNFWFDHNFALKVIGKEGKKAPGVINVGRPTTGRNFYKYAKGLKVFLYLLSYVKEGAKIYDPFCGIANSAEAAKIRKCKYIGCDVSNIAVKNRRNDLFNDVAYIGF
jgi:hypothetical protein